MKATLHLSMILLIASDLAFASSLTIVTRDESGSQVPSRVLVRLPDGSCPVPEGSVVLEIGPDRWFMSPGNSVLAVPEGRVELRVERGPEFIRFKGSVDVSSPGTTHGVVLRRWIDMEEKGYRSGENHLHVEATRLAAMLAAEDLDFGTSMTWWNGPESDWCLPVPPGKGHQRRLESAGVRTPTSIYDGEIEYSWGAAYFLNLRRPMPLRSEPGRPNLDFARLVSREGGLLFYQAGWSREVAVDALLGYVQGVNVCNNNFHLHRFQPRSRYSNLLGVAGFPTYPDTDQGMLQMNLDTYYRLLNWGLRLAAGAGSATGFKEVPVGYNRAYVRVGPENGLDGFYKAWSEGRNFVTNGPMIFLEAESGLKPGDLLALPEGGGRIRARVEVRSIWPLTGVHLIVNGRAVVTQPLEDDLEVSLEREIEVREGAWIAAYCTARDDLLSNSELASYASGDRQQPSRLRFAHTSPIYVSVGGRTAAVQGSLEEGLLMLERFESFARETADEAYRRSILEATREARRRLRDRLRVISEPR